MYIVEFGLICLHQIRCSKRINLMVSQHLHSFQQMNLFMMASTTSCVSRLVFLNSGYLQAFQYLLGILFLCTFRIVFYNFFAVMQMRLGSYFGLLYLSAHSSRSSVLGYRRYVPAASSWLRAITRRSCRRRRFSTPATCNCLVLAILADSLSLLRSYGSGNACVCKTNDIVDG